MMANIALDTAVGWVPILGDLFDVAWKSNNRNMALLEQHLQQPAAARRGSRMALLLIGAVLLVFLTGAVVLGVLLTKLILAQLH
jgi:hypothetical protein